MKLFSFFNNEEAKKASSATYIMIMKLTKDYFQILLSKRARSYVAVVIYFESFLSVIIVLGLLNAPFFFCKLIVRILRGLENYAPPVAYIQGDL